MTKVILHQSRNTFSVKCKGHATGSVEVCAAVSCLVYTLAGWLENGGAASVIEKKIKDNAASASILFSGGDRAEAVFDMICVGFFQLEKQFPEYINVKFI